MCRYWMWLNRRIIDLICTWRQIISRSFSQKTVHIVINITSISIRINFCCKLAIRTAFNASMKTMKELAAEPLRHASLDNCTNVIVQTHIDAIKQSRIEYNKCLFVRAITGKYFTPLFTERNIWDWDHSALHKRHGVIHYLKTWSKKL